MFKHFYLFWLVVKFYVITSVEFTCAVGVYSFYSHPISSNIVCSTLAPFMLAKRDKNSYSAADDISCSMIKGVNCYACWDFLNTQIPPKIKFHQHGCSPSVRKGTRRHCGVLKLFRFHGIWILDSYVLHSNPMIYIMTTALIFKTFLVLFQIT